MWFGGKETRKKSNGQRERERKRETEWRGMEGGMERERKRDRGRAQVDVSAWMNGIPTAYMSGASTFCLEQELFPKPVNRPSWSG